MMIWLLLHFQRCDYELSRSKALRLEDSSIDFPLSCTSNFLDLAKLTFESVQLRYNLNRQSSNYECHIPVFLSLDWLYFVKNLQSFTEFCI